MAAFDDVAVIEFDDGTEVRMNLNLSTREYLAAMRLLFDKDGTLAPDDWLEGLAALIDKHRASWTLEGDALDQERGVLVAICREWLRAVAQVPLPLARLSSSTAASPEPSTSPAP